MRTRPTPNADPARLDQNAVVYGPKDLTAAVKQRMAEAGVQPGRKDAVLCAEFVLTASPEFFENKNREQVDDWATRQSEFLRERYGENLVQVVLHMDETTPHVHAAVVPITPDGKLSMKTYIGGAANLRRLQTEYAKAMEPLGLKRGVEHSVAEHTTIKKFYGQTQEARKEITPKVNIKPTVTPAPSIIMTRDAVNDHAIRQVQKYADAKNEAIKPLLAERTAMRADLSRTKDENRRLGRVIIREREARQETETKQHAIIIGLQKKANAFDQLRKYSPGHFQAAVDDTNAKIRAEVEARRLREEAQERAKRQAQVQDQLRLQQQLERRREPENETAPRRAGPVFRR